MSITSYPTENHYPQYIKDLIPRLEQVYEQDGYGIWGYTWRLYGENRPNAIGMLKAEAQSLVEFARDIYADSYIVEERFYYAGLSTLDESIDKDDLKRRDEEAGAKSYITMVITDGVAARLEQLKKKEQAK